MKFFHRMAPGFTVRLFSFVYQKFGPMGLLAVPFITMSIEKVCYDTFQAYQGHDLYTNGPREGAKGMNVFISSNIHLFQLNKFILYMLLSNIKQIKVIFHLVDHHYHRFH